MLQPQHIALEHFTNLLIDGRNLQHGYHGNFSDFPNRLNLGSPSKFLARPHLGNFSDFSCGACEDGAIRPVKYLVWLTKGCCGELG